MHMYRGGVLERLGRRQQFYVSVEPLRWREQARLGQAHAAPQVRLGYTAEIDCRALPGPRCLDRLSMHLQIADPGLLLAGQYLHGILDPQLAAGQRARHHRAKAFHGEHPVHWQAQRFAVAAFLDFVCDFAQRLAQIFRARPGNAADRDERRAIEERAGHEFLDFQLDKFEDFLVDRISLGQRDQAVPDSQQAADFEVLAGLRHHGLVCGHDQQDDVDPSNAGQHVLDEALVAGDVHEADAQIVA